MDSRFWLEKTFPEVSAIEFYRDLFPSGELDKRNAFTKGKYCGIALQICSDRKVKRYSITDELDNIEELVSSDDFVVISPMSYAGKSQKSVNQRFCYAIAIDLDGLLHNEKQAYGIESLFSQTKEIELEGEIISAVPRPTYVVASSANNCHLYYVLDKPIPMFKSNVESLARYKTNLTDRLWNKYITAQYDKTQQEPIGQGMRAVGSLSKDGKSRVRAFKTGGKVSIEYLNRFPHVKEENRIEVWNDPKPRDHPREKKKSDALGKTKPAFYEWFKRQIREHTVEGKRYFGLMALAIIGRKCGIDKQQVEKDALSFVPYLDSLTTTEDNHFKEEDALKAISAYNVPHFLFMKRETLVRLSGIPMTANKRNHRKMAVHCFLMREKKASLSKIGEGHAKNAGRPSKRDLVLNYRKDHPEASQRAIAKALGISPSTVNRWLKQAKEAER